MRRLLFAVPLLFAAPVFAQSPSRTPSTILDPGFFGGGPWFSKQELIQGLNAPNGLAGTDANGNVTAPVTSGSDWIGNWQKTYPNVDSYAWGYESALFGGQTSTGEGNNTFNPRSVFVQSDPYGPYSAGCATGVAMTGSEYSAQFPVSEVEPKYGAASVKAVGGFDTVANCTLISNFPARFIFKVAGYTANTVELVEPLTAAQAARLYPNMYITTNSPNPALTGTAVDGELPQKNLYAGFVKDRPTAGSTTIDGYAWDVPTLGTGAANQVPRHGVERVSDASGVPWRRRGRVDLRQQLVLQYRREQFGRNVQHYVSGPSGHAAGS